MRKKISQPTIKRSPAGKQRPSASESFAKKAKKAKKAKRRTVKRLEALRKEVIDAKKQNNQEHFSFATGIVGGGIAANFLAFQTGGTSRLSC